MTLSILRYFHPVLPSKRLRKKPVRVLIAGHPIVLFREADGTPAALDDLCPHRRAPLSQGEFVRMGAYRVLTMAGTLMEKVEAKARFRPN